LKLKTLIKNGRVVTAVDGYFADIFIDADLAYGNDTPLYGAMGFVRKSQKESGLTRKKKSSH